MGEVDKNTVARGHQPPDERMRLPLVLGLGLVVLTAVAGLVAEGLVVTEDEAPSRTRPGREAVRRLFPEPRLDAEPGSQLARVRAYERARLEGYEVVDPDRGLARIPLERAMELTVARGFRVRKQEEDRDEGR